ncbi:MULTISPECIES: RecT family recombinase [unclassified Bacillus (in: firmicutes)]|uniref:RecT family recombinase n=1 Tax=unclassified Bacillus (in: firmicutes) TaxID=185979 RepID=UPI001BE80893|nr:MULTISPECIES: RecT family recombinase [unclassified Bacillus (in: firmicutes)]MBT2614092.1 recombinase RecT [Bacillus sp. ISL-78]MBT2629397.1 recombinase RecT [Bacillus sp. ISL-101]
MANNNSIVQYTPEINEAFKPEVLQVIRNSIAPTANDQEFLLFAHKAASYGLDPFKNEIFFIKYGNTARIQFAAEAYLSKAREQEGFQPPDTQMVCENDEFKVAKNSETKELEVVTHEIGFPRGEIIGAYSISYREGQRPVTVIMDRAEIEHMFKGQNKDNWVKWTADMFGKHVQQRALKKQYGLEFGDEDIPQPAGEAVPGYKPKERKDITPNQEVIDNPKKPSKQKNEDADAIDEAKTEMVKKFERLGIPKGKARTVYIEKNARDIKGEPTLPQLLGLLELMDMHIDMQDAQHADADELE